METFGIPFPCSTLYSVTCVPLFVGLYFRRSVVEVSDRQRPEVFLLLKKKIETFGVDEHTNYTSISGAQRIVY